MSERANQEQPAARLPGAWVLLRDILSFLGGWGLIFLEVQRPEIRESVLIFAGAVIGIPGLAVGVSSLVDAYRTRAGIGGSPSDSASSVSSQSR